MIQQTLFQVLEGSGEEVAAQIEQIYAGRSVRVIIEQEEVQPSPPFTVRDETHLHALLLEGLAGPFSPITDDTFEERKQEVRRRIALSQQVPQENA